ncbi:MAG: hypothetical protein GY821_09425 [Gammaproteobacteria bacterium]|nr:hypothetical protein [Gammaproteobacteria bacterium]
MSYKSKTAEDMIPDQASYAERGGTVVRKGTMAAALANAEIIETADATEEERQQAMTALKTLAPPLKAMGLTKFLHWNNPAIQALFDQIDEE